MAGPGAGLPPGAATLGCGRSFVAVGKALPSTTTKLWALDGSAASQGAPLVIGV